MQDSTKTKTKFIYWFAYYNLDSPSVRYRGQYPLEFLKANYDIGSYFIIPGYKPLNILRFLRAYFSALFFRKTGSEIVIQRINSNFVYANLLKFLVKVRKTDTYYDLDDADYLDYPPKTIYFFIKNCSAVFVGSHELVKNLSAQNKNIILNTSPTPDLEIIKTNKNALLTVGWIGGFGGGHKKSLLTYFFPALKDFPFKIKLVLLGVAVKSEYDFLISYFKDISNIELEMPQDIVWTDEKDIQKRISTFDIGIAKLLDDELHRFKSAFKLKQYFNNGVPVLSSDLPENNLFLDEGKNGFFCSRPEDFRKRIIEINEMKDNDYMKLSDSARNEIPNFNLTTYCDTLVTRETKSLRTQFRADLNGHNFVEKTEVSIKL